MGRVNWPDIEALYNVRRYFRDYVHKLTQDAVERISYRGKIKLHGTNAGNRVDFTSEAPTVTSQSRSQDIFPGQDNMGFALWSSTRKDFFVEMGVALSHNIHEDLLERNDTVDIDTVTIFGEWAGKGIMKGTSISNLPGKMFMIFGAIVSFGDGRPSAMVYDPEILKEAVQYALRITNWACDPDIHVLPWATETLIVDVMSDHEVQVFAEGINARVDAIDKLDPWVKETFNLEGPGEGLVFYPIHDEHKVGVPLEWTSQRMFKAKGSAHQVKQAKAPVEVDATKVNSVAEFVSTFVTVPRCEQGLQAACEGKLDMKSIGLFLAWMGRDVEKESEDDLKASGLTWKDVSKDVTNAARKWYVDAVKAS